MTWYIRFLKLAYKLDEVSIKAAASVRTRKQLPEAAWRGIEANCPVSLVYHESTPLDVKSDTIPE